MGRRGPTPEPTVLRMLRGNPGRRPLNDSEPQPEPLSEQDRRAICPAWLGRAHPLGTSLVTSEGTGAFDGLEADGALRLRLADGTSRVIHAGDVFLV